MVVQKVVRMAEQLVHHWVCLWEQLKVRQTADLKADLKDTELVHQRVTLVAKTVHRSVSLKESWKALRSAVHWALRKAHWMEGKKASLKVQRTVVLMVQQMAQQMVLHWAVRWEDWTVHLWVDCSDFLWVQQKGIQRAPQLVTWAELKASQTADLTAGLKVLQKVVWRVGQWVM